MSPARRTSARAKASGRRAKAKRARTATRARAGKETARGARARKSRTTAKRPARSSKSGAASRPKRATRKAAAPRSARARASRSARPARASSRPARRPPRPARRPAARVVLVPTPKRHPQRTPVAPPPPAFAGAITGASARHLALFQIVRARVTVLAAVQGLGGGSAEREMTPGQWSPRQLILHLAFWDQEFLRALEPALHGNRPVWAGESDERSDLRNAEGLAALEHLDWDEALRELNRRRQELMDAIESIPEEPVTMWGADHALGWLVNAMSRHDLDHAAALKQWRAASGL